MTPNWIASHYRAEYRGLVLIVERDSMRGDWYARVESMDLECLADARHIATADEAKACAARLVDEGVYAGGPGLEPPDWASKAAAGS